ncbi:hypothetical protein CLAIMM_02785 [Cladophialophora immunda]|nr:hypothetical protein CLAIMM_02785 [Cladophialophora immunda]
MLMPNHLRLAVSSQQQPAPHFAGKIFTTLSPLRRWRPLPTPRISSTILSPPILQLATLACHICELIHAFGHSGSLIGKIVVEIHSSRVRTFHKHGE